MSGGSDASNLGYGNSNPLSNINASFVDKNAYNGGPFFSDNIISGTPPGPLPGLSGTKSNILSAAGVYNASGGSRRIRKIKNKIKNITKYYKKMKGGSRKIKSIKNRIKKRLLSRRLRRSRAYKFSGGRRNRKSIAISRNRNMKGGWSQYQNNTPITPTYQVAGINLPSSQLSLANPPPITTLCNSTNCVDNYNHYTNKGFPSKGN
jgi:hypothetical protein